MVKIRLAKKEDFDFFFRLKCEDFNIFWAGGQSTPDKERLKNFFYDAVDNAGDIDTRKIYIIESEKCEKIGHLYIIPKGKAHGLATAILERNCGKGYGRKAIRLALEEGKRLGFERMTDYIREDNIASLKAYQACGVKVMSDYNEVYIPKLCKNIKMYRVVYEYEK